MAEGPFDDADRSAADAAPPAPGPAASRQPRGLSPRHLSTVARTVWAKHDHDTKAWMPLWRHMADSAAVAGLLWDRWLPRNVRWLISEALPDGERDGRLLAVWLAAVHDIGKATPAFACQVDGLPDRMRELGLAMPSRKQFGDDRKLAPHGLAGQLLLREWLEGLGWPVRATNQLAAVVGGHHGSPPDDAQVHDAERHPELLRTASAEQAWRGVQTELLEACAAHVGVRARLQDWRAVRLSQPAQVLLSALVIVADWIASNPELFPYTDTGRSRDDDQRVAAAWRGLDLPAPWRPTEPPGSAAELFAARFRLPAGACIRPVQQAVVDLARDVPAPGLMIVEAPMGEGKTEAALAGAEILAARSGAGGCFIALPTMATSNAMFPRLLDWLDHLPACGHARLSVLLAHSKSALNEEFAALSRASSHLVAAVDVDGEEEVPRPGQEKRRAAPAELVAHQWLRGRKKGMLSTFVVGTIDQLLMAGLKGRHLALRHLAVAGKVVVIDEAHAYDAYMNCYLDRVLGWLGAYRVPVVVLSATLPAARRRELAEAYAGGGAFPAVQAAEDYPLLTGVAPGHDPMIERPVSSGRRSEVMVERFPDDMPALVARLEAELASGGCALVVRNTVDRALETAKALRTRFGAEAVTVAHARFLDLDRAARDRSLLDRFGRDAKRPERHIVVATQVAEQSLDVDFDLLVTDLAPVDLVLQRMGRLHRHRRGDGECERPERLRQPRCLVTGVEWDAAPPEPIKGSRRTYGEFPLLRSAAVLLPHLDGSAGPVRLPQDISTLVQQAYGDAPVGPDEWAAALSKAREDHEHTQRDKQYRADTFRLGRVLRPGRSLVGWLRGDVGDADDTRAGRAQVRDSGESLEVLVVQERPDGSWTTVDWLDQQVRPDRRRGGLPLPLDAVPTPRAARTVAACGLRLPWQLCLPDVIDKAIVELERACVPAWQVKECHWLAGELLLVLDPDGRASLAGHQLHYTPHDGLEITR